MAYGAFAQVYDRLMDDVDYTAWYQYYRALLIRAGIKRPQRVADICCGTGQFAVRLAGEGAQVVGIDASEDMLAVAQQRAREAGVRLVFAHMDATSFKLPHPAEVILCACDGLNYFTTPEAVQRFFTCAYRALQPGGVLAFDVSTSYKFISALDGRVYGEDFEDLCYLWVNQYDKSSRLCHMELSFFRRGLDGRYDRAYEEHLQRAHTEEELRAWLVVTGFSGIECFSEMTLGPVHPDDMRIHFLALRA